MQDQIPTLRVSAHTRPLQVELHHPLELRCSRSEPASSDVSSPLLPPRLASARHTAATKVSRVRSHPGFGTDKLAADICTWS